MKDEMEKPMKDEAKDEGMMGLEKPAKKKAKKPAAPKAEKKESKSESKPKAKKAKSGHKVHEMRIRKAGDGYVVENHHAPDETGMTPPMEEFAHPHLAAVHDHMEEHMGEPNPGEAEAEAGAGQGDAGMEPAGPAQAQMA